MNIRKLHADDGENLAVRAFLARYGAGQAPTVGDMRDHMRAVGWADHWPDEVCTAPSDEPVSMASAQRWLSYLFELGRRTPGAHWRQVDGVDPHGSQYDCERSALPLGRYTDDELANAVFLHYDQRPALPDVLAGRAHMPITYVTAAKDRIRWLSRALARAIAARETA